MQNAHLSYIESKQLRKDVAQFNTGDTVRVHWKIKEGDKERVQAFDGVVIRQTRGGARATFTVRKMSYGVGVERIFPFHSPRYEKVEIVSANSVHRSRLFYLRNRKGKAARLETQDEAAEAASGSAEKK